MRLAWKRVVVVIGILGCSGDLPTGESASFSTEASFNCPGAPLIPQTSKPFDCNAQITVYDASGLNLAGALDVAAGIWNKALQGGGVNPAPSVSSGSIGSLLTVRIKAGFGGNGPWCGETDPSGGTILLISAPNCPNNRSSDFAALLVHELSHAIGFTGGSVHKFGGLPAAKCAHYLPDDLTINRQVCQAEVEWLYATYGLRSQPPDNIWSTPIATGIDAPDSMSLAIGASAKIPYSHLLFANSGDSPSSRPLGSTSISWTAPASPSGSVALDGTVTAGQTDGYLTATGKVTSLQPGYALGTLFDVYGKKVVIHVLPPPPPSPPGAGFRVSAITTSNPVPFTSASPQTLTAVVENGGYPVDVLWKVSYSDSAKYNLNVTTFNRYTLTIGVHTGSYNIQVQAQPRNGILGTAFLQNFPVCTGSGGGGALAPIAGGVSPNSVTGC